MRIATWNCNGALRRKTDAADALEADVFVVQECESPADSTEAYRRWAGRHLWIGRSRRRGLGVFVRGDIALEPLHWFGTFTIAGLHQKRPATSWCTSDLELFLPVRVDDRLNLVAVWTKPSDGEVFSYIGQLWKFVQIHRTEVADGGCMIVGDFNSNARWDRADRWWNHSDVVRELADAGLASAYHALRGIEHGAETEPTFFMHRQFDRPYHVDYAFLPAGLLGGAHVAIGDTATWLSLSDHLPLVVTLLDDRTDA